MPDEPLLILGCERTEYRDVTRRDLLVYVLLILAFSAIFAAMSLVWPATDPAPQDINSNDRTMPAITEVVE
jgi:hypothetical protein